VTSLCVDFRADIRSFKKASTAESKDFKDPLKGRSSNQQIVSCPQDADWLS